MNQVFHEAMSISISNSTSASSSCSISISINTNLVNIHIDYPIVSSISIFNLSISMDHQIQSISSIDII